LTPQLLFILRPKPKKKRCPALQANKRKRILVCNRNGNLISIVVRERKRKEKAPASCLARVKEKEAQEHGLCLSQKEDRPVSQGGERLESKKKAEPQNPEYEKPKLDASRTTHPEKRAQRDIAPKRPGVKKKKNPAGES